MAARVENRRLVTYGVNPQAEVRAENITMGPDGARYDAPLERNLWERAPDGSPPDGILSPLDPAPYGIDPLNFIDVARA